MGLTYIKETNGSPTVFPDRESARSPVTGLISSLDAACPLFPERLPQLRCFR